MKIKTFTFLVIGAILVVACAPSVIEEAPAVVVEENSGNATSESEAAMSKDEQSSNNGDAAAVSFNEDIWPILEAEALTAHGGSGGVFLESYEDIMKYVVPGKPEESALYQALTGNGQPLMPPNGSLPDEQIQLFYDWILQGANNN